jgi:hypothetical protein
MENTWHADDADFTAVTRGSEEWIEIPDLIRVHPRSDPRHPRALLS